MHKAQALPPPSKLVSTAAGKTALLEDASCTARTDQHLWRAHLALPCDFTLDLAKACP